MGAGVWGQMDLLGDVSACDPRLHLQLHVHDTMRGLRRLHAQRSGAAHGIRGDSYSDALTTAEVRFNAPAGYSHFGVGFRCARSP